MSFVWPNYLMNALLANDPQRKKDDMHRLLLHVHYITHTHNVEIRRRVAEHIGQCDTLLKIVKKKVRWRGRMERTKYTW